MITKGETFMKYFEFEFEFDFELWNHVNTWEQPCGDGSWYYYNYS